MGTQEFIQRYVATAPHWPIPFVILGVFPWEAPTKFTRSTSLLVVLLFDQLTHTCEVKGDDLLQWLISEATEPRASRGGGGGAGGVVPAQFSPRLWIEDMRHDVNLLCKISYISRSTLQAFVLKPKEM